MCFKNFLNKCCPNKTFFTTFPSTIPKDLYCHFIRGLFDGDGSLYYKKDKQWGFKIFGTAVLLGPILEIFRRQVQVGGGIYPNKNIFYLNITGKFQIKRVLDWLYADATIYMDRKYQLYLDFIKSVNTNVNGN